MGKCICSYFFFAILVEHQFQKSAKKLDKISKKGDVLSIVAQKNK